MKQTKSFVRIGFGAGLFATTSLLAAAAQSVDHVLVNGKAVFDRR